jgi:hypothetical protein
MTNGPVWTAKEDALIKHGLSSGWSHWVIRDRINMDFMEKRRTTIGVKKRAYILRNKKNIVVQCRDCGKTYYRQREPGNRGYKCDFCKERDMVLIFSDSHGGENANKNSSQHT